MHIVVRIWVTKEVCGKAWGVREKRRGGEWRKDRGKESARGCNALRGAMAYRVQWAERCNDLRGSMSCRVQWLAGCNDLRGARTCMAH